MSYDEAAMEQLEGVVGGADFVMNLPDKKYGVYNDATSLVSLDSVDIRLLRIIRELDR
jgi:hypothetical protein